MPSGSAARPVTRYYPNGVTGIDQLNTTQQRLLIARHSTCSGRNHQINGRLRNGHDANTPEPDCQCNGLRPPNSVKVKLQTPKSSNNPEGGLWGWDLCKCGHPLASHGLSDDDDQKEFVRRAKVALRIDEYLNDRHKLLDFDEEDEDTRSLKRYVVLLSDDI